MSSKITPRLSAVTKILADQYAPLERQSAWYCDNRNCDGKPHNGWNWKHCRANQRPPESDWFVWLLMSGRGFGKSRTAAEWLVNEAAKYPRTEWAVVAPTGLDVAKCFNDLRVGINTVGKYGQPDSLIAKYNQTLHDATLTNGAIIHGVSADKPDRLRGFNLAGAWCDELSSWRYPDSWDLGLIPAIRDDSVEPRVVVTTTPKPVILLRRLVDEEQTSPDGISMGSTVITRGTTFDNQDNLAARTIRELRARYEGTLRGRQELYGELLTGSEGALITQDMIDATRLREKPNIVMVRTVVAVDPAMTSGEDADETGIIVCSRGIDGRGYVLADLSCKESPDGWARIAAKAYDDWGADRVVAEKNQGFDMVESIVRSVHPNIAYKGVHASQGKKLRAEPIAALYEQGKVSHVGVFDQLEDQWTNWIPDAKGQKSPDRVDALVHGLTELGLIGLPGVHVFEAFQQEHPSCQICSQPAPRGTPVCPKCGAPRNDEMPEPVAAAETTDQPWSITYNAPNTLAPNPHTQAVMNVLKDIQGPTKWWQRNR